MCIEAFSAHFLLFSFFFWRLWRPPPPPPPPPHMPAVSIFPVSASTTARAGKRVHWSVARVISTCATSILIPVFMAMVLPSPTYIDRPFIAISVFPSLHLYPSLSTYLSPLLSDIYKSICIYIYIYTPQSLHLYHLLATYQSLAPYNIQYGRVCVFAFRV